MTTQERDLQILENIRQYCDDIMFTHNEYKHDPEVFRANPTYKNAIALCLMQIGELVRKLSDEFVQAHTDIPWRAIRGMRNVVAHEYGHVDVDILWDTSEESIIELRDFCTSQIDTQSPENTFTDFSM